MPAWTDDLENLLSEALAGQTPPRHRKVAMAPSHSDSFRDPANWSLVGQVNLVHRGERLDTLIGLFDDYRHYRARDARRLIASTETRKGLPRGIEYVTGDLWLGTRLMALHAQVTQSVELISPIELRLGQILRAAPVLVTAQLSHGGLSRLLLDEATTFEGHTPREVLSLPKGLDILEGLSDACKRSVWASVKIELENDA